MLVSEHLKQLLKLLSDGGFHSGSELSAALGVSRSAVWKQLQVLPELGLDYCAVSGKGYKLQQPPQLLVSDLLNGYLRPEIRSLISALEIHDTINSTNTYLLERARHDGESGLVCAAEYQTDGKGRQGRRWVSPFGHNIYVSILWRFQDGPAAIAGLSLAAGVATTRALREFGLADTGLKWPNDILCRQRKLAGILIDVSGESGGPCHAVVGLGVNVFLSGKQAVNIDQPWIDLSSILGPEVCRRRNELLAVLLNHLMPVIADYQTGGIRDYVEEWRGYDCMQGSEIELFHGRQSFKGTAAGINDEGLLILNEHNGGTRLFASGEVSSKIS